MLKVLDAPGRHQSHVRLGVDKGGVHLGVPREDLGIPTQSISQSAEDQSSSMYKLPVEVHHSQEPLDGRQVAEKQGWRRRVYGEEQTQSWRLNVQDTQLEKQQKHNSPG